MSEEEKEAIEYLSKYIKSDLFYEQEHYNRIKIVLNLIDRLQTENEKLKKLCNKATEIIDEFADTLEEDNKKIHKYSMEKINNVGGDIE